MNENMLCFPHPPPAMCIDGSLSLRILSRDFLISPYHHFDLKGDETRGLHEKPDHFRDGLLIHHARCTGETYTIIFFENYTLLRYILRMMTSSFMTGNVIERIEAP